MKKDFAQVSIFHIAYTRLKDVQARRSSRPTDVQQRAENVLKPSIVTKRYIFKTS